MLNEMIHDAVGNTILFAAIPLFLYLVFSVLSTVASWFLHFMKMKSFTRSEAVGGLILTDVLVVLVLIIIWTGGVT